jgi:uncharacterized membrane protein
MEIPVPTITALTIPSVTEQIILLLVVFIPTLVIFYLLLLSEEVFETIGFRFRQALLMTVGALIGGLFNIPLIPYGEAIIAINVGGAIIPLFVTFELIAKRWVSPLKAFAAIGIVALIAYVFSTPVPGVGITLPIYIAPLAGAVVGLILARGCHTAPGLAYVGGTMGTLLGADLLNLANPIVLAALSEGSVSVLSIGGAGIFDGIFVTGVLAVLLAAYVGRRLRKQAGVCPQEEKSA